MTAMHIGEAAALATALFWTLSALAWTTAGKSLGAIPVSFIRLPIACVFFAIYGQVAHGRCLPADADGKTWLLLGLSGLLGFFISDVCLFKAFLLIGPRLALLIQSLTPPVVAVAAAFYLHDALTVRQWLAMAMTLAGVTWVLLEQSPGTAQSDGGPHRLRGILLAVLAAVAQAMGYILAKQGIAQYDDVSATYIRVLGAIAGYLVLVTLLGRWPAVGRAFRQPRPMAVLAMGAFVGPFLGTALWMVAVRDCGPGVTATIVGTMPIIILPFAVFLYREKVTPRAAGGAVLSVLGVAMLML